MALNKNINEAQPAFVGAGTAVQNGATNTHPSSDMISPQNIENSTLGGSEAVVSDTRHMFDFVNGKGEYGVFGRDFSYSISSLALVNPYAAGAVVGALGAGSLIYGIMTSAYVRSKQTLRRLRTIRNKVLSGDGYPIDNMNSFGFMKFLDDFTNWIGGGEKKVGVKQFYEEILGTIKSLDHELKSLGLRSVAKVDNLTPGEYEQKRSGINKVLNASYKDFYIASGEVNKASDRYRTILSNNRFKYDKNVEESYDKLMKRVQESNVNAPLYKRRDEYAEQINELGESLVNAFDTKMGYALKRGGNRAISCSKKLHATWKEMMKEIGGKLDEKVDEICVDSSYGLLTDAQEIRNIIEALYKKEELPLTIDTMANELYVGSFFMYRLDSSPDGTPVLLSVGDYDKDKWAQGLIVMKIVNSDIVSGGKTIDVPIKYVDDYIDSDRENYTDKSFKIGKRRKTDKFVRMKEIDPGSVKTRQWYRVNYRGSDGATAVNGMWTAVVYVFGIVDGGAYGSPGTQYVQYRYANFPTYGGIGGNTVQMCEKSEFEDWIISKLEEYSDINANEGYSDLYDGRYVLNEYGTNAIYEDGETDGDKSNYSTEPSSESGEITTNANDGSKKSTSDEKTEADKRKESLDTRYNDADTSKKTIENLTLDDVDGELKKQLDKIGTANKGTYVLFATEDRPIVYTKNPIPGRVELYEKYNGKDSFTWEEWEKMCPLQLPFEPNPYDNTDLNDILLDDGVDDVKDDDNYPLTYGGFGRMYMEPKYMFKYTNIFSTNSEELKQYDIIVDNKTNRCTGLCKSNLDAVYGKYSLSTPSNFKTYIIQCIASEVFIKDKDEMSKILKDSSTANESCSIKYANRLFEGHDMLFEKRKPIIKKNTTVYNGLSIEDVSKLFGLMLQYGAIGATPQKLQQMKQESEEHKDASVVEDVKKEPIDGIPDIVRKVCIEILRDIHGFIKKYDDGIDRTKFNNPPMLFRGVKSNIEEILSGSHNDEYGINSISNISNNVKHTDKNEKLLNPKWNDNCVVDTAYVDTYEPVFYFSKDISTNTNDNESEVKEYIFFVRDKAVVVSDIKKFDESLSIKRDGVYMKGSDQEHKKDLDNANVFLGGYYLLPSDVFKSLHENVESAEETSSNESYDYSDKEFYKIFEDDNNDSTEGDEETIHLDNDGDSEIETGSNDDTTGTDSSKAVLVLVNSVKDDKVEFKYIKDSSLITDYASVDKTAKVDMSKYVYDYATDDKMKMQYYSVYQLSKEGYDFIANAGFVKDRSGVSMYANNTILVIPTLPTTTPTIEPMKVGVIDFIIGNSVTEPLPVLYEYALMRDFDNALTYVEWMSNISYGLFKTGDAPQYYKMSKEDFDKSFGLLIKQEEPVNKEQTDNFEDNKEWNTVAPQSKVNSGYYYDVDYFYKLYEADDNNATEDNTGSVEQTNTEDASANVKEVYIEIYPVSGSYKSMDSTTMFGVKLIAKCKTDVQLKEGGEAKETTEFSFNEQKLRTDIKIERLDDMPEGWDKKAEVNKGEEDKNDDNNGVKYEPYPDRGVSPIDTNSYAGMKTLKKWLTTIDLENNGSAPNSYSRGMMLDFIVSTFKQEVNKSSRFDGLGSVMKFLVEKTAEPHRFDNDINVKKYDVMYNFVNYIIDMFLAENWNNRIGVNNEKPQWLHYINAEGKEVQHEVKVEKVTDSSVYILYKDEKEGDKHYILPKEGKEYMIIESAFGFPTIRFKSHDMYMKHVLYNIPLNEALIVDFGGIDSFKSILNMIVNDEDSLYSIMSWVRTSGVYKDLVERYNKMHANDGNTTRTQPSQPVRHQRYRNGTSQEQPKPQVQPKPTPVATQGTNPTATGSAPTWTTTTTANV